LIPSPLNLASEQSIEHESPKNLVLQVQDVTASALSPSAIAGSELAHVHDVEQSAPMKLVLQIALVLSVLIF
jgi:hypothetical protein